ncbi:Benzil reductase S-benzoin forming IRC24 [Hondaea fermentalgiana]|uniref:Benzil reductase S-benzoin forming IRC24 n=1 Tax=Hondaea fermentalgiana TaxID=2315210 RepID=A0A2R5GV85_9STRA|nr:Benzil reductase S-benzoin forming IRC24 [Hondaea fermentalgiana]|eukprot:GBG34475.1 Benzil reductase S-benzoin forming IRC24 [Hondaea fermentalgiana]
MEPFRRAWISGGTRGIGLGLARALLQREPGSKVWVSSRSGGKAEGARALVDEFGDERVVCKNMDITDIKSVDATTAAVASESDKKLDLVINTVGLLHRDDKGPERRLRDVDPEWSVENYRVNALGPLLLARALVEEHAFDRERLCCLANVSAKVGSIGDNRIGSWYSYRGSKAAQNQFNKSVAIELTRLRRAVVCVGLHPGTVDTQLSQPFSGGISHEIFSVEKAAGQLLDVLLGIDKNRDHGQLLNWDGSILPP